MGKGTIFYVHGAGNREGEASGYAAALRTGFGLSPTSPKLKHSTWGERKGPAAALPRLDDALPEEIPADAGFAPVPDLADPLAPLKALAAPPGGAAFAAGAPDADQLLLLLRAGLVDLSDIGISESSLRAAAEAVATSPEYAAAAGPSVDVVDATLESVAAMAIKTEGAGAFGLGDIAKAIGAATGKIANTLLGSGVLSVAGSWIGTNLGPPAKLALSRKLAQERRSFMHKGVLVPADVLFYQRNGAAVRDFLRDEIGQLESPVVAIGHSLGGIALVDTLFSPNAKKTAVNLLVTFGSQSAFLESVGALGPLSPNLPWINIWTRYDFASFLASKLWPGLVKDVEVPIEVGFPDAHGAYYVTKGFFDAIKAQPAVKAIL
jgi:hypothetical protein